MYSYSTSHLLDLIQIKQRLLGMFSGSTESIDIDLKSPTLGKYISFGQAHHKLMTKRQTGYFAKSLPQNFEQQNEFERNLSELGLNCIEVNEQECAPTAYSDCPRCTERGKKALKIKQKATYLKETVTFMQVQIDKLKKQCFRMLELNRNFEDTFRKIKNFNPLPALKGIARRTSVQSNQSSRRLLMCPSVFSLGIWPTCEFSIKNQIQRLRQQNHDFRDQIKSLIEKLGDASQQKIKLRGPIRQKLYFGYEEELPVDNSSGRKSQTVYYYTQAKAPKFQSKQMSMVTPAKDSIILTRASNLACYSEKSPHKRSTSSNRDSYFKNSVALSRNKQQKQHVPILPLEPKQSLQQIIKLSTKLNSIKQKMISDLKKCK